MRFFILATFAAILFASASGSDSSRNDPDRPVGLSFDSDDDW
jgi:hypothetical protein